MRIKFFVLALVGLALLIAGCVYGLLPDPKVERLNEVVERDLMTFPQGNISPTFVDYLSNHEVIVLGENHHVQEHHALVADLVAALHAKGGRQLLIEIYHAYDGMIEDYVLGRADALDPVVESYFGFLLREVRAFNQGLPDDQKIHVRPIDINHYPDVYRQQLALIARQLADAAPLTEFLAQPAEAYPDTLSPFYQQLQTQRTTYVAAWGQATYDRILEMTGVELRSVEIRALWQPQYAQAHVMREDLIKDLVDARLAQADGPTLINVGYNHAQREHLMGTEKEWLGEYLAVRSPHAAGNTTLICVVPARGELVKNGGKIVPFDLQDKSGPGELLHVMSAHAADQVAFLPLDDPIFEKQKITVNYGGNLYTHRPKALYDGYVLLPDVHPLEGMAR